MRTVIIPAAGLASRMKPLSKGVSKAMIPVNGRPLISYIIEHLEKSQARVSEYIVVENELGDIQEFVKRVYPNLNFKLVHQVERKGPLHAIQLGASVSEQKGPVTVWLGDTICLEDFDFRDDFVAVHRVPDPHRWCLIDHEGRLYDKPDGPVHTNLALIGVYNFESRSAFEDSLKDGMSAPTHKGEHQIAALLENYMKLLAQPMQLVETTEWYDCGELNSYYESKALLLKRTARSFNKIEVNTFYGTIKKSSADEGKKKKIEQEKNWFKSLNQVQSLFCPRVLDSEKGVLEMTLEPGVALNEVLVYDNLRIDVWHEIIRKILKVHHDVFYCDDSLKERKDDANLLCFKNYFQRNLNRLEEIFEAVPTSVENQILITKFFEETALELCKNPVWSGVIHGDSHLGNIVYDPHSGNIKFVDPRGSFGDAVGTAGDLRYDMGKLLQDFYCGYSMMMAERYKIVKSSGGEKVEIDWVDDTQRLNTFLMIELQHHRYDVSLLKDLAILLLLTAIPFHADDPRRQKAFLVRCINLIEKQN
jgi:glucose-1-phosphate thymidylyltransferase